MLRPKLVFWFLIEIFTSIVTYFLMIIVLDLPKILLFFESLILFFDVNSVDASNKGSTIFINYLKISTIISIFFLVFIKELIIKCWYTSRLNINWTKFFNHVIFEDRNLRKRNCFIFLGSLLIWKIRYIHIPNIRGGL